MFPSVPRLLLLFRFRIPDSGFRIPVFPYAAQNQSPCFISTYILYYIYNLYLNAIIFKGTKAFGVVYLRIKLTYYTAKRIYKPHILYVI